MSNEQREREIAIDAQRRMFRLAKRDHALDLNALHEETGIPKPTLKSWGCTDSDKIMFAVIPLTGLRRLCRVIPDELTSLLLSGTEKCITSESDNEGDLDALAQAAGELGAEYIRARGPKSPGGINIVPMEREAIRDRARRVVGQARAVA